MKTNKKELYELLDLMQNNNLTKYGRDKLNSMVLDLELENERLKKLNNEELYRRFKALKYINKNMICDALYPASKVDGENIANILNGGVLNGGDE